MDCHHRHDSYMAMLQPCHQSGGKMAKITRFFTRKDEPDQPIVKPCKDVFDLLCREDWDAILSPDVEGEDIFNACVSAVKRGEIAGALKLLYRTSRSTRFPYSKSPLLNHAWQYLLAEVLTTQRDATTAMDMLAHAETDKRFDGEKALMNDLVHTVLTLELPPSQTPALQKVLQWCQREGLYSFGFDIALSAGNVEEAYSILTAVSSVSQEHVLMLQDIASQSQHVTHAESFVQLCFQRGRAEFAFALATKLQLWSVIEDKVEEETPPVPLLRSALTECVLGERWGVLQKILSHLSEQDVREELLAITKAFDVSTVIDVLVECRFLPVALQLACSFGMPGRAAQITQDTGFVMDPALSASTAKACFDSHCSPEEFLVKGWDRDLLLHVLEAPRRKPFSHNQWQRVLSFLGASLPKQALLELMKRAIEEDAECLDQFIDQGVNNEFMEALLTHNPEKYLSDNHLNCVAKLLYKEAGVNLKEANSVLTDEAVFSVVNPKKSVVSAEEITSSSGLDASQRNPDESSHSPEQSPHCQRGKKSVLEGDMDWTTFVPRAQDIPVCPWWYVLQAAQTARKSPHIRQLAVRAAQEGRWNCLICLSIYGLYQHPLDLLLSLLHDHPERLVLSYLKQREQWVVDQDIHCCREGWKVFGHHIDVWNLHWRDLLEERHKLILLGRALATDDWSTVMPFTSLDLPLPARRTVFKRVMERQEWTLAKEMFHQLPDKADPGIFQTALKQLDKTSEQLYGWMVESGLSNAYLAPEMFTRVLKYLDEKEAARRKENLPEPHHSFWKQFFPKPKPKSSEDFQRPKPAVTEKNKGSITSTLGRVVQKAAVKGDWQLVMKTYEGGMGEGVKMAVVQEALRQGQWSVLTALTRRDAEVDLWYPQWADKVLKEAVNQGAWSCVEALVERRCRTEDAEWLFPYAVGLNKWSLVLRLLQHALPTHLREEALQTAIQKNEWTFVVDCTLHLAETSPQDLHPDLKKAVLKSMTRMITALQPSSPPGATTFGLQLFSAVKVPDEGQGDIGGRGRQGEEEGRIQTGEEEEWRTEDGTTPLQMAAGLGLWQVCRVLLHCGINPQPSPTPSHPEDVILLALHDNQPDVIHLLLDSDVKCDITPGITDQVLQELLLTSTLKLKADLSLLHKLLERRSCHGSTSAKEQTVDVTQSSDVITDVSCDVKKLEDQVRKVLDEAGASKFQPCVSKAVKSGRIVLPALLSSRFAVAQRTCSLAEKRCVPQKLGPSEKRSGDALSCGLEVGPRVKLRVDKEPRDSPMVRLLSPLVAKQSFPPPPPPAAAAGAPATRTNVSPVV